MYRITKGLLLAAAIALLFTGTSYGAVTAYTEYGDFIDNLPGTANVLDFYEMEGDVIYDGDTVDGITFSYPLLVENGITMMVNDYNELGIKDDYNQLDTYYDEFMNGDGFSLSFASSNAIGMYFITGDTPASGDFSIKANGVSAYLDILSSSIDIDGYVGFFVGLIDDESTFTSAEIASNYYATSGFYYTVDDIITTTSEVPVPSTLLLLGSSFFCLSGAGRRIKKYFK